MSKNLLFIHICFPSQFHQYLGPLIDNGYQISAITFKKDIQHQIPDGIKVYQLKPQENLDANIVNGVLPGVKDVLSVHMIQKYKYAISVYNFINRLSKDGYCPNVVVSHEYSFFSYFVKSVWKNCRLICRMDLFHHPNIGMSQTSTEDLALTDYNPEHYNIVGKIWNLIALAAINEADAIYCATEFEKSTFPKNLQNRIEVIFDGIDTDWLQPTQKATLHPSLKFLQGASYVVFATRSLEPMRGLGEFMRSIPYVLKRFPDLVFLIIGNSKRCSYGNNPRSGKTWMEIYREKIVIPEKNLFQIEFIKHDVLNDIRRHANVNVYLTYDWVLSWSLVESMSLACSIVASDTAPVREFIEHGVNGRLVNLIDPKSIAQGIIETLENPEVSRVYGERARETVVNHYRGEQMAQKFLKLLV